ncbi:hypothetical protein FXO38_13935 [Capsicum annuum]|nr:hypothetical protein FXO38_13935 [Capsicum annuum]
MEEEAYNDNNTQRVVPHHEEEIRDINIASVMSLQNPWMIKKIITHFDQYAKSLVLSSTDIRKHVFEHWMKKMVNHIDKGNTQSVELLDITEENDPINYKWTYVQKMMPCKEYALVCVDLFTNHGLLVGDEIGLYGHTKSNNFKCTSIKKCPFWTKS